MRSVPLILVAAALFTPAFASAQLRESTPRTSSLLVVRTSGNAADTRLSAATGTKPRALTTTEISAMINPQGYAISPIAGPWKVTLRNHSSASGRILLDVFGMSVLMAESEDGLIDADGRVQLRLRASAPGEKFLIDCIVYRPAFAGGYQLLGPGGAEVTTTSNHLMLIYEAPDTQWAVFGIKGANATPFMFDSCTVSRITK